MPVHARRVMTVAMLDVAIIVHLVYVMHVCMIGPYLVHCLPSSCYDIDRMSISLKQQLGKQVWGVKSGRQETCSRNWQQLYKRAAPLKLPCRHCSKRPDNRYTHPSQ